MDWTKVPSNESPSFPYWGPEIMKKMPGWTTHLKKYETHIMIVSNLQGFFSKDKKSFKKPPPKPSSLKWCQPGDILWGVYGQLDWPHWTGDGTVSGDGQGYTPIPTSKPVWEIPKKKNAPKLRGYLWMNNLSHYWQGFYTSQVVAWDLFHQ